MNTLHTKNVDATGPHVDGIDVTRLLLDLGEASAASSAVHLFGLLLRAQQVLAQVQTETTAIRTPREAALFATYLAMDDNGQDRLVSYARQLQKRFPRQCAALMLIPSGRDRGYTR